MNAKKKLTIRQVLTWGMAAVLAGACAFSTVKLLILGLNVDEEYAVTMGWRIAGGEHMFTELWEPHQTSAFVCAALIRLHTAMAGSINGMVLFLRCCGMFIGIAVSVYVWRTMRRFSDEATGVLCGLIAFAALPKMTLIPEFSNLLYWGSLCCIMSLLRYQIQLKHDVAGFCVVIGACFMCVCVLAYPSSLIAFVCILFCLHRLYGRDHKYSVPIFITTCIIIGSVYLIYFLAKVAPGGFAYGVRQMMTDGTHSDTALQKLAFYGREVLTWLPILGGLAVGTGIVCVTARRKSLRFACGVLTAGSLLYQIVYWFVGDHPYLMTPMLFYYTAYVTGLIFLVRRIKDRLAEGTALSYTPERVGLLLGMLPSAAFWLSAMLLTNTGLRPTGAFLIPGVIVSIGMAGGGAAAEGKEGAAPRKTRNALFAVGALFLLTLMISRCWFVYENHGYKADIFFVKQKALSGTARNIYCRYLDGYDYNTAAELLGQYGSSEESLLVAAPHSLWYTLSPCKVGTYSTISTPVFDHRLTEYWEAFPDRYPDYVIGYAGSEELEAVSKELPLGEVLAEKDGLAIYRVGS